MPHEYHDRTHTTYIPHVSYIHNTQKHLYHNQSKQIPHTELTYQIHPHITHKPNKRYDTDIPHICRTITTHTSHINQICAEHSFHMYNAHKNLPHTYHTPHISYIYLNTTHALRMLHTYVSHIHLPHTPNTKRTLILCTFHIHTL